MKTLLKITSFIGLAVMLGSSLMVFNGAMADSTYHTLSLIGTLLWFVTVPFWMKRRLHQSE